MTMASHILLATDFSEASESAVTMAGDLARSLNVQLTVLNVHGSPPEPPGAIVPPEALVWSTDLDSWSMESLNALRKTELNDIEHLTLATEERGFADKGICDYAREHDVDLIIVGSHARTGLAHLFLGSVAEKVVKHAPCPVLVVPVGKEPETVRFPVDTEAIHETCDLFAASN